MKSTSGDGVAVQRPPGVLLAAAILIFLSLLLAGAEWWSDRQGYDWTMATMIVPQTRYPSWDYPVTTDGSELINSAENLQYEAARQADGERYDAMMARKLTSIVLIGVMFVAAWGCGFVAWKRMLGRRWSRGASMLCVLCRNMFMLALVVTGIGFGIAADPTAFNLLLTLSILSPGVLGMAYGYAKLYRILRVPPNGAELEIPLPLHWIMILATTIATATTLFIGGSVWLGGKQRELHVEADRLSMESATIAKAFTEDALKSGKAKYANRKAWKQAHPFDHRFDDRPF